MLHPQKTGIAAKRAAARAARQAILALSRLARPAGDFDSSRYFRGPGDLGFYNVGTAAMRELARSIHAAHKAEWSIDEAMAFAEIVHAASVDAQAQVTVVEKRMQGRDHPVLLGVPETYYLKCFILRKLA